MTIITLTYSIGWQLCRPDVIGHLAAYRTFFSLITVDEMKFASRLRC